MENFKAGNIVPDDLEYHQRKKFFKDANHYFWDDPYQFKVSVTPYFYYLFILSSLLSFWYILFE